MIEVRRARRQHSRRFRSCRGDKFTGESYVRVLCMRPVGPSATTLEGVRGGRQLRALLLCMLCSECALWRFGGCHLAYVEHLLQRLAVALVHLGVEEHLAGTLKR